MKQFILILIAIVSITACRPVRKIQKIDTVISKKDTVETVIVKEENTDSLKSAKEFISQIEKKYIDFKSFSAKVRVEYQTKNNSDKATANFRIMKDSLIWVSLTGALGIEGFRMMITKDSVKLMNKLDKTITLRSIDYLQEITQIPFDFATLQNLIVGNPVLLDDNVISYKESDNNLLILMSGAVFKHLITIDKLNNTIVNSKIDDVDPIKNRTCVLSYGGYEDKKGMLFSTLRRVSVAEKSSVTVDMEFKQYSFNENLTYPFSIPKNYKREN